MFHVKRFRAPLINVSRGTLRTVEPGSNHLRCRKWNVTWKPRHIWGSSAPLLFSGPCGGPTHRRRALLHRCQDAQVYKPRGRRIYRSAGSTHVAHCSCGLGQPCNGDQHAIKMANMVKFLTK